MAICRLHKLYVGASDWSHEWLLHNSGEARLGILAVPQKLLDHSWSAMQFSPQTHVLKGAWTKYGIPKAYLQVRGIGISRYRTVSLSKSTHE